MISMRTLFQNIPRHLYYFWRASSDLPKVLLCNIPGVERKPFLFTIRESALKLYLRPWTHDVPIVGEVFAKRIYNPQDLPIEIALDSNVIDIGAQIGAFSCYAGNIASKGKVVSIEPQNDNYHLLRRNITANHLSNVTALNLAVSDFNGIRELYIDASNTGGHSLKEVHQKSGSVSVQCYNLKTILKQTDISFIDLLKIDCEGVEAEILFSIKELMPNIQQISMEYHDGLNEVSRNDISKFLEKYGYQVESKRRPMIYAWKE